jgi:hypothetical protein
VRQVGTRPLWLGHAGDGRDLSGLHARGVAALVDLAREEPPAPAPLDLAYLRFPLVDGSENPAWLVRSAAETIARLVLEGVPTLICCGAGMSRSPAIAAAGLALAEGRPIEDCLEEILEGAVRDVSPSFWRDLKVIGGG